ncbi:ER membrane protein complex subunit 7-like isoform X2 [Triplophysa rosa]|uniref:ER membrane protein complex subunit 7-like isoform X2 n=1 Tax=Triplophysa rosa TaxID=992332 RepID=UPI00254607AC|nr:ER membrane protein complex subunit 7-like isoform X2 [Triplophysa rosa]
MHMNHCLRVWVVLLGLHVTISHEVTNDVTHEGDKDDVRSEDVKFQVLGRAVVPGVRTHDWISSARVLLDGDKHVGFLRARVLNYIKTSEVIQLPYPLQMRYAGPHSYFIQRETWGWSDFFMNPMVYMMVLPLLIIVLLPKVINPSDPEMQREVEQSMNMLNPNTELPDVSELMTKFFSPPKSQKKPGGGTRVPKGGGPGQKGGGPRRRVKG